MAADAVPIAIKPPSMQAVGSFVLPKNCIYTVNFCSSESFPAAIDALMDLFAAIGNLDRAAATHRDRIETSARGFLEGNATSCVDGAVCTVKNRAEVYVPISKLNYFNLGKLVYTISLINFVKNFNPSLIFLLNYILVLFAFVDGYILTGTAFDGVITFLRIKDIVSIITNQ